MNPSEKLFILNTLLNEGYEKLPGSSRWVRVDNGKEFENMYRAYEDYVLTSTPSYQDIRDDYEYAESLRW